jgi:hypothetical protein
MLRGDAVNPGESALTAIEPLLVAKEPHEDRWSGGPGGQCIAQEPHAHSIHHWPELPIQGYNTVSMGLLVRHHCRPGVRASREPGEAL